MLELMTDLPDNVVGIRATGMVGKEDYEKVIIPALNDLVQRKGKINYLMALETPIQNFTIGAWIDDARLGLKHFTKWNRIAIVTNQTGVERLTDFFGNFLPCKTKSFTVDEIDIAKQWVSK